MLNVIPFNENKVQGLIASDLFADVKLNPESVDGLIIQAIENGKLIDQYSFIDAYGFRLNLSELSDGCKSVLSVLHHPNSILDVRECGYNALGVLFTCCFEGTVIVDLMEGGYYSPFGDSIDLSLDGHNFTSLASFNYYLSEMRWRLVK